MSINKEKGKTVSLTTRPAWSLISGQTVSIPRFSERLTVESVRVVNDIPPVSLAMVTFTNGETRTFGASDQIIVIGR